MIKTRKDREAQNKDACLLFIRATNDRFSSRSAPWRIEKAVEMSLELFFRGKRREKLNHENTKDESTKRGMQLVPHSNVTLSVFFVLSSFVLS